MEEEFRDIVGIKYDQLTLLSIWSFVWSNPQIKFYCFTHSMIFLLKLMQIMEMMYMQGMHKFMIIDSFSSYWCRFFSFIIFSHFRETT